MLCYWKKILKFHRRLYSIISSYVELKNGQAILYFTISLQLLMWLWPIRGWLVKARLFPERDLNALESSTNELHQQTSVFIGTSFSCRARGSNHGPLEICSDIPMTTTPSAHGLLLLLNWSFFLYLGSTADKINIKVSRYAFADCLICFTKLQQYFSKFAVKITHKLPPNANEKIVLFRVIAYIRVVYCTYSVYVCRRK